MNTENSSGSKVKLSEGEGNNLSPDKNCDGFMKTPSQIFENFAEKVFLF